MKNERKREIYRRWRKRKEKPKREEKNEKREKRTASAVVKKRKGNKEGM